MKKFFKRALIFIFVALLLPLQAYAGEAMEDQKEINFIVVTNHVKEPEALVARLNSELGKFWLENSLNKYNLKFKILDSLDNSINFCEDEYSINLESLNMYLERRYLYSEGSKVLYIDPKYPCQGFTAGISTVSRPEEGSLSVVYKVIWQNMAHEIGHAMGLGHASSLMCEQGKSRVRCESSEYGHSESIMGGLAQHNFKFPLLPFELCELRVACNFPEVLEESYNLPSSYEDFLSCSKLLEVPIKFNNDLKVIDSYTLEAYIKDPVQNHLDFLCPNYELSIILGSTPAKLLEESTPSLYVPQVLYMIRPLHDQKDLNLKKGQSYLLTDGMERSIASNKSLVERLVKYNFPWFRIKELHVERVILEAPGYKGEEPKVEIVERLYSGNGLEAAKKFIKSQYQYDTKARSYSFNDSVIKYTATLFYKDSYEYESKVGDILIFRRDTNKKIEFYFGYLSSSNTMLVYSKGKFIKVDYENNFKKDIFYGSLVNFSN